MLVRLTCRKHMRLKVWQRLGKPSWLLTAVGHNGKTWSIDTKLPAHRESINVVLEMPAEELDAVKTFVYRAGPADAPAGLKLEIDVRQMRQNRWLNVYSFAGVANAMIAVGERIHLTVKAPPAGRTVRDVTAVPASAQTSEERDLAQATRVQPVEYVDRKPDLPEGGPVVLVASEDPYACGVPVFDLADNRGPPAKAEEPVAKPEHREALAPAEPAEPDETPQDEDLVYPHRLKPRQHRATEQPVTAYCGRPSKDTERRRKLTFRLADHVLGQVGWRRSQRVQIGIDPYRGLARIVPVGQLDDGYQLVFHKTGANLTFQLHPDLGLKEFEGTAAPEMLSVDEKGIRLRLPAVMLIIAEEKQP